MRLQWDNEIYSKSTDIYIQSMLLLPLSFLQFKLKKVERQLKFTVDLRVRYEIKKETVHGKLLI